MTLTFVVRVAIISGQGLTSLFLTRLLQEVVLITMMGLMGVWADRVGRPVVYVTGLLLTSLGFALYPHAESIGELVVYRLIVAFGGAAMVGMMVTVVADYASDKDRAIGRIQNNMSMIRLFD